MSINNHVEILKGGAPVPKIAMAAMLMLVASVVALVMFMRAKPVSSKETVPGQELVVGVDSATLYVPKDVATMAGVITISALEANLYPVAGEDWLRPQVVNIQYLNREAVPYLNVVFSKPVLICFQIRERWQDYTEHPNEYLVQYYAEKQDVPGWVTLPMSANPERYQLCGQTNHLSTFALALKPQKEIPVTGKESTSTPTPTPIGFISPTPSQTPTTIYGDHPPVATPVSTQAALTATSVALTATEIPPTDVPPTATEIPPTDVPPTATDIPPTAVPPTDVPPTAIDTPVPPTDPPATQPPVATDPPATQPPVATDPPIVVP
jgi:hypothetical protein